MRLWLFSFALLAAGCASTDVWREISTPHFVLRTDLDSKQARQAALALEATRDALVSAAWPRFVFPPTDRTHVIVLANGVDFEHYFGPTTGGLFVQAAVPTFYLYGPPRRWELRRTAGFGTPSVLRHEMAHQLAAQVYQRQPRWFAEGLAEFLSTVYYSADGRSVVLGAANVPALNSYFGVRRITVKRALEWERDVAASSSDVAGLYGTSWFFVHWVYNVHPEAFGRLQEELGRGTEPKRAFEIAFPDFDAESADKALYHYARFGQYNEVTQPLRETQLSESAIAERRLLESDVHVVRAQMADLAMRNFGKNRTAYTEESKKEIEKALALDPTHVPALQLDRWTPLAERLDRARRATRVHADDTRAWALLIALLSKSQSSGNEIDEAYRRLVALAPGNPWLLNSVAWALLEAGRASAALPLASQAAKRVPWSSPVLDTYARALFEMGSCKEAILLQLRAQEGLSDRTADEEGYTTRLEQYRNGCRSPAKVR